MNEEKLAVENEKESPGKLFLPSLVFSFFAVSISAPMLVLLTVDMAKTFFGNAQPASVGAVAQVSAVNSAAEVVFALLMGVLAVRFRHKSLLLIGVLLLFISAVGSFFAPTLLLLQVFYALEGGATVIVGIMGLTLVGEYLPSQRKAKAVSYLVAGTALASIVALPMILFINHVGGWQLNFLWFVLPVSVAGLVLAFFALPAGPNRKPLAEGKGAYLTSFKQVLLNKSAASCLIGGLLIGALSGGLFAIAFYRTRFSVSTNFAGVIFVIAGAMYIVASLVVGRLVNRFGAKTLAVGGAFGGGALMMLFFFMPNFWAAFTLDMVHVWFAAAAFTAFTVLALDQVPKSRGTMMSMKTMFGTIGGSIGAAVGGAMLVLFASYQAVGLVLGAMGVVAAAVFYLFTKDPMENKTSPK